MRKRYYLIGAILIIAAAGFILYNALNSFSVYYYYISEYQEKRDEIGDTSVRIAGIVAEAPVIWDMAKRTTEFTITDNKNDLIVIYSGSVPSTFEIGTEVVVFGRSDDKGVFQATELTTKCASKYEAALEDKTK